MAAEIVSLRDAAVVAPAPVGLEPEDGGGGTRERHGGGGPGDWPADCPVRPLGMSADGKTFIMLDSGNRLVVRRENELARAGLFAVFNQRIPVLKEYWPRQKKVTDKFGNEEFIVVGTDYDAAQAAVIAECGRRGTLDIANKVRGPGAWRGPEGELILHCGDRVLISGAPGPDGQAGGGQWRRPGEYGGAIYPDNPPSPLPSDKFAGGGGEGPARLALRLFGGWNWQRPELDPMLLLGALGAAKIGGALDWRPTIWLTGDFGTGKSTLLKYYMAMLGEGGHIKATNTSAAGIWQSLRFSSFPVILDEAEATRDPRLMEGMIKLARDASSGGVVVRGGDMHNPVRFVIQSCFVFGSIIIPGLAPQDKSRIAVLALDELTGITPPATTPAELKALGEALTRRMIDAWPRLPALFEAYRQALAKHGHDSRSADQHGILLACADLLLNDHAGEPASDYVEYWAGKIPVDRDTSRDHENCVDHLLSAPIEPFRGGSRKSIALWLQEARGPAEDQPAEANRAIETYGLKVRIEPAPGGGHTPLRWLYVANSHRGLAQLFTDTHWAAQSGTSSPWVQALRRVPGAEHHKPGQPSQALFQRFAGFNARCLRLPLDYLLDGRGDEKEERGDGG